MIRKVGISAAIVAFWVTVIFAILFLPSLFNRHEKGELNVLMWSGMVDPKVFSEFKKRTGITVNVSYYSACEELIVKLLATKGKGYDLIVPSDYIVQILAAQGLLKKLDKSKLTFYDKINPKFLGHYYDPTNEYSIPGEWYLLGLGINTKLFKGDTSHLKWDVVFDPACMPNNIGLLNDARELISLAVKYRYGTLRPIDKCEMQELKTILCAQKKKAEAYTDFRGDFLLESGNCPVVIVANIFIWRTARDNPELLFVIPEEGTFLGIENYVIPEFSDKEDQAYQLMNFLFDPEIQKHNFEECALLSTRTDATYLLDEPALASSFETLNSTEPGKFEVLKNVLTDEQVNELWLAIKTE